MTDHDVLRDFERDSIDYRKRAAAALPAAERLAESGDDGAGQVADELRDMLDEPPGSGSLGAVLRALRDLRLERTYLA